MISVYEYEIIFHILLYGWLCGLLWLAAVPLGTKAIYMLMITPVFVTNSVHRVLTMKNTALVAALSLLFFFLEGTYRIQTTILLSVLGAMVTLSYYVPIHYLILVMTIVLTATYACILVVYIASTTDGHMLAFFVGFISIIWLFFAHLRPPFVAIH